MCCGWNGRKILYVVQGRLKAAYAAKYAAIALEGDYARPPEQMRQRMLDRRKLDLELDSIMYEQLRLQRPARSAGLIFTSADEQRIADGFAAFPMAAADLADPQAVAQSLTNRYDRLELLAPCFSPDKMLYYKLDREGDAEHIGRLVENFHPTRDEFFGIAAAVEDKDSSLAGGVFKDDVAKALHAVLTPDRFELFQSLQRDEIRAVCAFAKFKGLSPETTDRLVRLRLDLPKMDLASYREQVQLLIQDPRDVSQFLHDNSIHPGITPPAIN